MKTTIKFQGRGITISSRHVGLAAPSWANGYKKMHRFRIKLECGGKCFKTDFQRQGREMTLQSLLYIFERICFYAKCGGMSMDDYHEDAYSGIGKFSDLLRCYNECRESFRNFQEWSINPDELRVYLRETYDL